MFRITKREKDYLLANGCKYHVDIFRTTCSGKSKWTYACESNKILNLLEKYYKD